MKAIKLLRDHHTPEGIFKAGETIKVSDEHYKWLTEYYAKLRREEVGQAEEARQLLKKAGVLNDATSD